MAKYTTPMSSTDGADDGHNFQAESDAHTLMQHQEIMSDPDRHQAAHDHLQKKMQAHKDAYRNSRKQLQKKTKGRLKNVFGNKGENFGQEEDKERGEMEQTVNTKE